MKKRKREEDVWSFRSIVLCKAINNDDKSWCVVWKHDDGKSKGPLLSFLRLHLLALRRLVLSAFWRPRRGLSWSARVCFNCYGNGRHVLEVQGYRGCRSGEDECCVMVYIAGRSTRKGRSISKEGEDGNITGGGNEGFF